jgi:hypothetical protein
MTSRVLFSPIRPPNATSNHPEVLPKLKLVVVMPDPINGAERIQGEAL